jgi:hypothetical protein
MRYLNTELRRAGPQADSFCASMRFSCAPDRTAVTSSRLSFNASSKARITSARVRCAPDLLRMVVVSRSSSSTWRSNMTTDTFVQASRCVRGRPRLARGRAGVRRCGRAAIVSIIAKVVASTNLIHMPTPSRRRISAPRVGRPPAGDRGERVKDYPQVSFRLPKTSRDKLVALSKVRQQPQWRLIVESVECYLRDLPRHEQAQIRKMVTGN